LFAKLSEASSILVELKKIAYIFKRRDWLE